MEEDKDKSAEVSSPAANGGERRTQWDASPFRSSRSLMTNPRAVTGAVLIYGGVAAYIFLGGNLTIQDLFYRYSRELVAIPIMLVGAALFYFEFLKLSKSRRRDEPRFVDVDLTGSRQTSPISMMDLADKIEKLQAGLDTSGAKPSGAAAPPSSTPPQMLLPNLTFVLYFDSIRNLLEQKAEVADKKASILLDKGTKYSRFGIGFFVFSILLWQLLAHFTGFKIQYIYGIVSTSLLFIFIEFLSAWFLKQYRHFVDTSTYLIKVKSIFDKYMLVYLAGREAIVEGHDSKKAKQMLLGLLGEEIQWPDTYLNKSPDISFAKEALEAMTLMAKSLKADARGKSEGSTKKEDAA